jgi:hypothetical protein
MKTDLPVQIDAYGYLWEFSPEVVQALQKVGVRSLAAFQTMITHLSPTDGFQDGDLVEAVYYSVRFSLAVKEFRVEIKTL